MCKDKTTLFYLSEDQRDYPNEVGCIVFNNKTSQAVISSIHLPDRNMFVKLYAQNCKHKYDQRKHILPGIKSTT